MPKRNRVPGIIPDDTYDAPRTRAQIQFLKKRNVRSHRHDCKRQLRDCESDAVLIGRRDNKHSGG